SASRICWPVSLRPRARHRSSSGWLVGPNLPAVASALGPNDKPPSFPIPRRDEPGHEMDWVILLARHLRQRAEVVRLLAQLNDPRTRQPPLVHARQVAPRDGERLLRAPEAQQQVDEHLRGIAADRFRIGLLDLLAEV